MRPTTDQLRATLADYWTAREAGEDAAADACVEELLDALPGVLDALDLSHRISSEVHRSLYAAEEQGRALRTALATTREQLRHAAQRIDELNVQLVEVAPWRARGGC